MQLFPQSVLFLNDKQWVVEVSVEGSPNYMVCQNWGDIMMALEEVVGRNILSPTFNLKADFKFPEDNITLSWKEMSRYELSELPDFEGF